MCWRPSTYLCTKGYNHFNNWLKEKFWKQVASCYQVRCRYPAAARADGAQSSAWPRAHFPSTKLNIYPLCCLVSFPLQKQIVCINIEKRSWGTGEMGQQVRAFLGDPCRGSAAAVTLYTCFIHCTGVKISISRRLLFVWLVLFLLLQATEKDSG